MLGFADIVLTDDNFASIVAAIEEGRRLFDNIQKFVLHLLATNVIQVTVLLLGLVFKDDEGISIFPLSPGAWLVQRSRLDASERRNGSRGFMAGGLDCWAYGHGSGHGSRDGRHHASTAARCQRKRLYDRHIPVPI